MTITSMIFLFLFLPVSLAIYYLSNDNVKEYVLLGLSLFFYALGDIHYIILFCGAISVTVLIGRTIWSVSNAVAKKTLLVIGIVANVGMLFYYKYFDFTLYTWGKITSSQVDLKELLLPLGISFFTFKAISYLVDVYTGKAMLAKHVVSDALYLSFFAQIQSGPLARYNEMSKAETKDGNLFADGVYRFLVGFSKKILIADTLSKITTEVFTAPLENCSTAYVWLGSMCFSLQLFFDFAGYSDMAIGLSEMFGYKCQENFNYPYMTESVSAFWRRWHISLSEWFRDYVYIPLGGSRVSKKWRIYFNLLVVWVLTGIWHGASWNFIFWGLGYFFAIVFERITNLPGRIKSKWGGVAYRIIALLFINFQWVLFNSNGLKSGLRFIKTMIVFQSNHLSNLRTAFLLKEYYLFIFVAIILSFPVVPWIRSKLEGRKVIGLIFEIVIATIVVCAFVWSLSVVVAGLNNPFAYANF